MNDPALRSPGLDADSMEHRWGIRRPVDLTVRIVGRFGIEAPGFLRNVSVSGAFVRTTLQLPLLSTVRVVPPPGLLADDPVGLLAYVARHEGCGCGIEWWSMPLQLVEALSPDRGATSPYPYLSYPR